MTKRFDLQTALLQVKTEWDGNQSPPKTGKEIDKTLNKYEDRLLDSPFEINSEYEEVGSYLSAFNNLGHNAQTKLISLITQLLYKLFLLIKSNVESGDLSQVELIKESLEKSVVLANSIVCKLIEERKNEFKSVGWDHLKISIAENLRNLVSLQLGRLFDNLTEKDTFVSAIARTIHLLMEQPENVKLPVLLDASLNTLSIAAKYHNFVSNVKTMIIQDLTFFEHLAEPCAKLLAMTSIQFELPLLTEEIYKELGNHNFTSTETNTAKLVSLFFVKHVELAPRDSLKYLNLIIGLLDVESTSIRMAIVELLGKLISFLQTKEDRDEQSVIQSKSLFSQLEERLRDVNAFVRCKVLSVLGDLCKCHAIPVNRRSIIIQAAINRVKDKSTNVRKRAIQLLGEFIKCHPFGVDGGELDLDFFKARLDYIEGMVNSIINGDNNEDLSNVDVEKNTQVNALLMQKKYYQDATLFVEQISSVIPTLCLLLSSNVKTEVFEVMDFLVDSFLYRIKDSVMGVRKMVQLIWEKDLSTEDGGKRSVKEHLIECYAKIYICTDDKLSPKDRLIETTQNLIKMMSGLNLSDLTCLEELIKMMSKKRLINENIVLILLNLITNPEISSSHRQNSLKLFSFLAKDRPQILEDYLNITLKVALGPIGQILDSKLPSTSPLFSSLENFICSGCFGNEWLPVVNQIIGIFYKLSQRPQDNVEEVIKRLGDELVTEKQNLKSFQLIKFLFVAGEIALCHLSYLDQVEKELKNNKQQASQAVDSLDQVTYTIDDEIIDIIRNVKEQELLFVENSILARIAPFILRLATKLTPKSDCDLYRVVLLTLGKFMCISSKFCELNLGAFLGLLETCPDGVIRGNLVVAFGDIALTFNRLADPNLQFLTRRLEDSNMSVKRKALLVLTHLSLNGMIKAKVKFGLVAKLLVDENDDIAQLARVFFHEISSKDNTIYNNLPDIISTLSVDENLQEESFALIIKHLFEYVKKERQMENLIEKLCQRFKTTDDPKHWRYYSQCLAMISFSSEKSLKTLISCVPFYIDKMVDERVFRNFAEIVTKCKKFTTNKNEIKTPVEEFEQKLLEASGNINKSLQTVTTELRRLSIEAKKQVNNKNNKKTTNNTNKKSPWMNDELEEEDSTLEEGEEEKELENNLPNNNSVVRKSNRSVRRLSNRAKNLILEDE